MQNISHIHGLKNIFFPFSQSQAIHQKMRKRTGGKLFQTADAVFQNLPVKRLCHTCANPSCLLGKKCGFHQLFEPVFIFFSLIVPSV